MKLISYSDAASAAGVGIVLDDVSLADLTKAGISSCMIDVIERFDALKGQIAAAVADSNLIRSLSEVQLEAPIPKPRRNAWRR